MSEYFEYGFRNEEPSHTHDYLLPKIKVILAHYKSSKILDVGCGNGSMAIELIKNGYDAYGIDASEKGIDIAKRNYSDRFFLQDINSKTLPKELENIKFDTIISTEVIEHLYSPKNFIDFCRKIILITPYHGYLKNLIIALSGKWDTHHTVIWEGHHIKFWSKKTLTRLLNENGFKVTKFVVC